MEIKTTTKGIIESRIYWVPHNEPWRETEEAAEEWELSIGLKEPVTRRQDRQYQGGGVSFGNLPLMEHVCNYQEMEFLHDFWHQGLPLGG